MAVNKLAGGLGGGRSSRWTRCCWNLPPRWGTFYRLSKPGFRSCLNSPPRPHAGGRGIWIHHGPCWVKDANARSFVAGDGGLCSVSLGGFLADSLNEVVLLLGAWSPVDFVVLVVLSDVLSGFTVSGHA